MKPVRIVDEVLLHEEEGEAFLLHVPSGSYYGLNKSGVIVWNAIAADADPVERMQAAWPNRAYGDLSRDVENLVDTLIEAGLLRVS